MQVYLGRLNRVDHITTETVNVGAGCLWEEVYQKLLELGCQRGVVDPLEGDIGVAGYLLGGGYSLKTNQFGLGIDNITAIQIVLPDGVLLDVNKDHDRLLFKALKASLNHPRFLVVLTTFCLGWWQ